VLHPLAIADLERSGIAAADAERAGLFSVDYASTIYPEFRPLPALVLPYFTPGGEIATFIRGSDALPFCRIRYLTAQAEKPTGFVARKDQRYTQPKASGVKVYFPPLVDWSRILEDVREPCLLTEGEKKSLAAAIAGFPVLALGGVFNFMAGPSLIPELASAQWAGRDVYICFDSDAATNPNILAAEARLVDELQVKRGAKCYLVRLPAEGDSKVGLDDYLAKHGAAAFVSLLQAAPSLGSLDAKVVALNQSVAWISRENLIYDLKTKLFISKDSFVNGEHYGAIKHITVGGTQRSAPKEISVAATWLKHPHAKRFSEVLFRPSQGPTVIGDHGRPALNLWGGFDPGEGSVEPFLQLNKFLFQNLPENLRDLPLKILAYKAQNPQIKVPLALVLLGEQGSGKSLWTECVVESFAPYGTYLTSRSFYSEFQGWLETSLMAAILEAKPEDLERGSDMLKSLISDLQRPMNEKYRPARLINSYTFYILTSNEKAAGAFSHDDRRMFVTDCPRKREAEFYKPISEWKNKQGGPKALLGYLLNMDLKGWVPPASAPMTAEKDMARQESLTVVERLAEEMRTAGDANVVAEWLQRATKWANEAIQRNDSRLVEAARATLANIATYPIRPWYTPEELTLLFPYLSETLYGSKFDRSTPAGQISRELRNAGIHYLRCADNPKGFVYKGLLRQFLVICQTDDWREPMTQDEFDRRMREFPVYGRRK
jgi:hypothetical protein